MEPMEDAQEAHFRKLIREAGADAPSDAFPRAVMQRVEEEAAFRALLAENAVEVPSDAFTAGILAQIQPALAAPKPAAPVQAAPKPMAFRHLGYWAAAAWVALLVACFFVPSNEQHSLLMNTLNNLVASNQRVTNKVFAVPQPFMLTAIGLCCLLLVDYFLRNRAGWANKTAGS